MRLGGLSVFVGRHLMPPTMRPWRRRRHEMARLPMPNGKESALRARIFRMRTFHLVFILFFLCFSGPGWAQDTVPAPFSPDDLQHGFSQFDTMPTAPEDVASEPMDYYKNPTLDLSDFTDAAPGGLLRHITLAESFEEDLDLRRGHRYYPIRPTKEFSADALAIHVVFRVFKHYSAYEIIGRLFPENVPGSSGQTFSDEESAYLALEDESGYLKFFPPSQAGWTPGQYRIDIFVGYEANEITRMGTLRFTVTPKA